MYVRLMVKNVGPTALGGVDVGLISSVLAGWKASGGGRAANRRIEGSSIYWLNQKLKPGQTRRYETSARVCAAATAGSSAIVEAAVYRLNATTGGVACFSGATAMDVSRLDRVKGGKD